MSIEKKILEKQEHEPRHNIVMVNFLRHGSTEYQENLKTDDEKALLDGKFPRDLTEKGEEEVRASAEKIIETINPETDIVVLWSSPAWRAQGSEEILKELLEGKNIEIYKDSSIDSMRSFDQHDKDYMNNLWKEIAPTGKSAELMYARDPEFQKKNDRFETQNEVKERAGRVFDYIGRLAKHAELNGKRMRFIGVSHFEFINPVVEDIFGPKIETGEGIGKGEEISLIFDFDIDTKEMKISADYKGEHKENIIFDEDKRKFITNP